MQKRDKWIALAEVKARAGIMVLGYEGAAAFVTVLVLASTTEEVVSNVRDALDLLGLDLIDCTDIETFAAQIIHRELENEVKALAGQVNDENPVAFDEFCVYPAEPDAS
jgi:hypothetical protein